MAHARHVTVLAAAGLVLAAGATLFSQRPPATEQTPAFRGGVDLIQLVVSVLDDERQPVRGLSAADFTILDEGIERPVRVFTPMDLPPSRTPAGEAGWTSEVAPDVATNQVGDQPGRLVIILMDRSIPLGQPTITARAIAAAAVDELGPADLAALLSTSGGMPQNFTADRSRLLRAIDQRDWSTGISKDVQALETIGKQDPLADGRCLCGLRA